MTPYEILDFILCALLAMLGAHIGWWLMGLVQKRNTDT